MSIVLTWLYSGIGLIAFEAVTAPGLGIFLAGLGAVCTAFVLDIGLIDPENTLLQFTWFFGFTVLWTVALWKRLKNFRSAAKNKTSPEDMREHSDMVGTVAVVVRPGLTQGKAGQAIWSGTIMTAQLPNNSTTEFVPEGTSVVIQSVVGTTLIVQPVDRS